MDLPNEPLTKVYVCSPYRPVSKEPKEAETELKQNIHNARVACSFIAKSGLLPIAPHLFFPQFLDDSIPKERELGMMLGRELLCGCDELWVFGNRISEGMEAEIKQARSSGIPVHYYDEPEKMIGKTLNVCEEILQKRSDAMLYNLQRFVPVIINNTGVDHRLVCGILSAFKDAYDDEVRHGS